MGPAGRRRAGRLRAPLPGGFSVGPVVADDSAQARGLPRRLRRVRPDVVARLRRAGRGSAAHRRLDRPASRQDRGGDRERPRHDRPPERLAAARALLAAPARRPSAAHRSGRLGRFDARVGGAREGAAVGRVPLRRADHPLRRAAGLRRRQRPSRGLLGPRGRRGGAAQDLRLISGRRRGSAGFGRRPSCPIR